MKRKCLWVVREAETIHGTGTRLIYGVCAYRFIKFDGMMGKPGTKDQARTLALLLQEMADVKLKMAA